MLRPINFVTDICRQGQGSAWGERANFISRRTAYSLLKLENIAERPWISCICLRFFKPDRRRICTRN